MEHTTLEYYAASSPELGNEDPVLTLFHLITLLMMSSIPFKTPTVYPPRSIKRDYTMFPSLEALKWKTGLTAAGISIDDLEAYTEERVYLNFPSKTQIGILQLLGERLFQLETTIGAPR